MEKEIYVEKISEKHNDSFWYEGDIKKVMKDNGTVLLLVATGDIRIHDKNGEIVYDGKERNAGIEGGLNDDTDLQKIKCDTEDDYHWVNNNWFEVLYKDKDMEAYDCVLGDVAHTYDDALELLQSYINDDRF